MIEITIIQNYNDYNMSLIDHILYVLKILDITIHIYINSKFEIIHTDI